MPALVLALLLLPALLLPGCAENPVSGQSEFVLMSEDQEIALGREAQSEVLAQYGRYDDAELQEYVQRVGEQLARRSHRPELIYRFTVVDSDDVNAFALPGGYIYITRGMLAYLDSEAQLAAVLGHEVGHVTARHAVQRYTAQQAAGVGYLLGSIFLPELRTAGARNVFDLFGGALLSGYGRDQELEADRLGAVYLARTGYDPQAMIRVISILKDQEQFEVQRARQENREPRVYHGLFASHPDNDTRLQQAVASASSLQTPGPGRVGREAFLHVLDGITFGPGEKEGVVRGSRFYHRELGFGLRFPEGWRIENRPDRLLAYAPGNAALLQLLAEDLNRRIPPQQFLAERLGVGDARAGRPLSANGLSGYTALAPANTPFGRREVRVTVMYFRDKAYVFAGAVRGDRPVSSFDGEFLDTARSLHPLTEGERALAAPRRLELLRAGPGTTYEALARGARLGPYAVDELRLLNGDWPRGEPAPGALLKVVR